MMFLRNVGTMGVHLEDLSKVWFLMDIDHSLFQSGQAIYPCTSPLYTSLNRVIVLAV